MAHGLLVVDKPVGPTSFDAVARVRRLYGVRQVGHGGTLDPLASGVLPVLVGEATKLAPYLVGLDKEYVATARLGAATDTYDAEGRVVATSDLRVDEAAVRAALATFVGRIAQRPPAYSAIKKDGQRLYARARAGETVEADAREVEVHEVRLVEIAWPDITFVVRCGKGTYIRSIAHDLGGRLGTFAHLCKLRRTRVGGFSVDTAVDPFARDDAPALVGLADAIGHLPSVTLGEDDVARLRRGQQGPLAAVVIDADLVRVLDGRGALVAVAERAVRGFRIGRVFS